MKVIDEEGNGVPVTEIYAFVAVHAEGDESIAAAGMSDGTWLPLVTTKPELVERMRPLARQLLGGIASGKKIKLIKLTNVEVLEEL